MSPAARNNLSITTKIFPMSKILSFVLLILIFSGTKAIAQAIGTVDKKTKELYVPANQKIEYQIFGYQYANNTTQKMICFSSHMTDVKDNYSRCPLGSYYDTDKMKPGDKIVYVSQVGKFARMNYVAGSGKKTMFYLPKSSFVIK